MKATIYSTKGEEKSQLDLPAVFKTPVREDLILKYLEVEKLILKHAYAPSETAGKRHSASGTISHKRHDWKGHYGKGISRVPRKAMWRRGTQFFWIAAEISSVRGGRRAHPPKIARQLGKINKKEMKLAMNSAIAATTSSNLIEKRYASIENLKLKSPIVLESKLDKVKTKELIETFRKVFGDLFSLVLKKKETRAGKGKLRGRKYKSNAGLLLVTSDKEEVKISGIEVRQLSELAISDLYPLGRLTVYTEGAIKQLGGQK